MLKNYSILILFVLSFFTSSAHLSAASMQYDNLLVERVDISIINSSEDTMEAESSIIQTKMKSRPGELFSQTAFDNDLKTLIADYDRIEPALDVCNNKVVIALKVWPKPTIRRIFWDGNCKIERKKLIDELDVAPGTVFDRRGFNQAFHKLKNFYIQKGFFEAQLNYSVCPDECTNQVDITINIDEGRAGRIKEIVFVNFDSCEKEELTELLATKEYFFLTSWLTNTGIYHEEAIQQDEYTILNFLHNKGYADAQVTIEVSEADQNDRIIVTITACKGERYRIGCMTLKGNTLYDDADLYKYFIVREGGWYSPESIRNTVERLTNLYGKYGYIDTVIDYEPKLSSEGCIYDIDFTIEEGEQFRIGLVKIFGNCTTQTRVILNEISLVPGEVFNILKLKLSEARLANIGFFKTVNVYAVKSDGVCGLGDNYRDVHIEVEETQTGHFGVSCGFSTMEELFGGFSVTETNFNYKGFGSVRERGFSALRGGGEFASFNATIGSKSRSYVISWNKPYVCDTPWVVGFDIDRTSNRYIAHDYDFESSGIRLHADYPLNAFVRVGCYYRLKYTDIKISDHEEDKAEDILDDKHSSKHQKHISEQLLEEQSNSGIISGVGVKLVYDATNNPVRPTSGLKSRLDAECIGVGGKHHWLGFSYLNAFFLQTPPWDVKGIWKFRANFRFLQPYGTTRPHTIPLDERLFLGGEDFLRGFRPFRLGPKYPGQDPRGGMSTQFYSIEYSFPVFSWFEGFTFCDAGSISLREWDFARVNVAVGWGARLNVVPSMPPITVGWGIPLNKTDKSNVKQFFLSLGGGF